MSSSLIFHSILILLLSPTVLSDDEQDEEYILPTYHVPSHYFLNLVLNPRTRSYKGSVEINFSSATTLGEDIKLHASPKTIKIQSILLNSNHRCTVTEQDNNTEIVILTCPTRSFQEENTLKIRFKGKISTEDYVGLFKITYEEDGEENVMLVARSTAMNARQIFPCFDEPKWKTTFDVFITHPNEYVALANNPVIKQFSIAPHQIKTQFETTPLMSTYMISFVVATKFVSNTNKIQREYDYRIFTRPSAKEYVSIATEYGPAIIDLLGNWTGISYKNLGDIQAYQVVIPNLNTGGLESWGLMAYGEIDLLDEKEITSNSAKQDIIWSTVINLAQQWFGNYVTLDWWSNTWVNKGLATYFAYYITNQLDDNLEMMNQFVVDLQDVLQIDVDYVASLSSHVYNEETSDDKFNSLTYLKGASIIRMLRSIIGETAFRKGLQKYLSTYKYNNTNPSLLLDSFKDETPLGLDKIMKNWIYKSGFPLVTAKLNGSTVTLTQKRFTYMDTKKFTQWYIPITYTTKAENNIDINIKGWLLPNSKYEIELNDDSWIIFNIQQSGYYRVNYDDKLWQRIIYALNNDRTKINVLNRAQLISDIFNIARVGKVNYQLVFQLAEYLKSETEYYPWVSAFNALSFICRRLGNNETGKFLQNRILYWINSAFPPRNPNIGSSHIDKLKEVLILDWACKLGQEECIAYANETFQKYKTSYSLPDNNKRGVVFCYGLRYSPNPAADYDFLFKLYKNSTVLQQKDIISSLGCTRNNDLLSKYLAETLSPNSPIKKNNAESVFTAVYSRGDVGINASLSFLENYQENITTRFKGTSVVYDFIMGLVNEVSNDQLKRIADISGNYAKREKIKEDSVFLVLSSVYYLVANRIWTNKYAAEIKIILQDPVIVNAGIISKS